MNSCRPVDMSFFTETPFRFDAEVVVRATSEQVFDVFEDADSWVTWAPPIQAVEWTSPKPFGVGTTRSYRAKRLTPQGERRPSAITNVGVRYDLRDRKTSLIATVSDVFDTLRDRTVIDTPALQSDITRRRSSRIVYIGFVRYFGKPAKKSGDEMEFDESL
jgi:hypothetical protein